MNYDQKLALARIAYRQIAEVIESFEGNALDVQFYWPKNIEVDGEMFFDHQLKKDEPDSTP
jgi:hypothetical protein